MATSSFTAVMFACSLASGLTVSVPSQETHIFVDTSGSQIYHAQYSEANSFTDVFQAQEAIRGGLGRGTTTVVHVVGKHFLPAPFMLDDRDSGTAEHPIHWQGEPGSKLSGGIQVPVSSFSKAAVPSGASGVVKADLFPLGFNTTSLGNMGNPYPTTLAQLYVDGQPMLLARTPNVGHDDTWMWYGYEAMLAGGNSSYFDFNDTSATAAMTPALATGDLWIHTYSSFDWRDTFVKIDSIAPNAPYGSKFTVNAKTPPQYPFIKGSRFYAVDSLSFLDSPGEYFIDRTAGTIYYYPFEPLTATSELVVSHLHAVVVNTASHVSFTGMTVSDATGTVFESTGANNVTVSNSTVSNGGRTCLSVNGDGLNVLSNVVFGCGGSGISVVSGNVHTLERGDSNVVGNTVSNFSLLVRTYQPAIGFNGVGMYIANNSLSHGPHTAITGGGNNNLFEFNLISHVCFECTDTGAFYIGRSWSQRGNVVRYNVFDTIRPTERLAQKSCSQNAFYLDDQMSGYEFYGNTIINSTTGVLLGGGRRNLIHNNTFINNDVDIAFDDRGLTWQLSYCNQNCTSTRDGVNPSCFYKELEGLNYTNPPYSIQYPELLTTFADHPCTPVHNMIEDNQYCHAKSKDGGKFITATDTQINSWMSTIANNVEKCDTVHA
eukprot:m.59091 g.59091  ORF g.59091 m.59091 type:complete len:658 (-) comp22658_c0_seq1:334-2307(-)